MSYSIRRCRLHLTKTNSGVFELEISGYQANIYLNGEPVQDHSQGVGATDSFSTPVTFIPGRNILAVRYTALDGFDDREMTFRIFHWNISELSDKNYGRWQIKDSSGLRRYEFEVK